MRKQNLRSELQTNPHLERALATQLIGMGMVIRKGIPLYQQFEQIPYNVLGAAIDAVTGTVKGTPRAAVGLIGGTFNVAEELVFGTLNAFSSDTKIPSYRQSLIDTKRARRW